MLIAVLWVVLLLAVAAASFSVTTRARLREAAAETARAKMAAMADAGVNLALKDLVNGRWSRDWVSRFPSDGRSYACTADGYRIVVAIEDEAGKVDLNAAGPEILRALLIGVDVPAQDVAALVDALLDFRDADDARRSGGSEREAYAAAGREAPKNAPFDSTLELAQVLGMDQGIIARLRPFITTATGASGVDPAKASQPLMEALLKGAGHDGGVAGLGDGRRELLPAKLTSVSPQRVFRVRSTAFAPDGGAFRREAIVRVVGRRAQDYAIVVWRQASAEPRADAIDVGPC